MNGGLFFSEIKKQKKFLNDNKSIIIDIDMNKYVEELSNNLNSRIMTTTNWKEVFQYCKQTLQINKTEVILNIFILLERLANKIDFTDFEIKTYYNNILPEILLYINSQNTHFKNLSRKVLSNLIKQDENIEFVVRFLLLEGLESNDFILKFNSVLALKLLFEQNYNFFCNKVNYTRKIISSLIYHSHDKSDRLSCLAIENLKEFIAGLPNYSEIAKGLSYDLLLEIDELKYKEKLNNKEKIDEVIQAAEKKKFTNQINEDFEIYKKQNQNTLHNSAMCINGFYFAVFPQIVVEGIDVNFSNEARIENFKKFKAIYEENNKRQDFAKFISSFFDFTVGFCEDKINLIAYSALIIIDSMISYIPGINLLVNMYSALPKIIRCLSHQQTMIRDQTKEIPKKVMMLLPTSSIFSFFVNNLDNGNWFLVSEVLNMIHFMLSHLNEIFNDIDFSEKQFDVSSFIKILSLFRHPVPKVRITAKKIIKYVGENVIIQERFLDTLEQIISDELFSEVKKLFKFKTLPKETSNYLDYNEDKMNVASSQMIQKLKEEINLKEFNEENDNKSEKDFKVFKNIKVYKDINDLNKSNNIDK